MFGISSVSVHPEIQDGAPVFSGTRVRVETFFDYLRIGVSPAEFLDEFPSITRDQVMEVYDFHKNNQYNLEQMRALAAGPDVFRQVSERGLVYAR
jgi:uncharacterized protein (DUF433 family)